MVAGAAGASGYELMEPDRDADGETVAGAGNAAAAPARARWPLNRAASLALVAGLLITAALAVTALVVYDRNEQRLLNLRVRELSLVVAATAPSLQTPLASAAALASATAGSPAKFRAFVGPYVGLGRPFTSVSLWALGRSASTPTAVVGTPPLLAASPARVHAFLAHPGSPGLMSFVGVLGTTQRSLGFAYLQPGHGPAYAVYAETPLPVNKRSELESNAAFSDLDYAVYLGRSQRTADALVTSIKHLPVRGRKAADTVPFGAGSLTVVVTPRGSLGGAFFRSLPWIIAGGGALIALAAALLTDRLAGRRHRAEALAATLDRVAAENRRMYTEQRSISQTLQRALLPDRLPRLRGLKVDARYIPAASGVDVGGDWYDIVEVGERRVLLVIGDVSGHGLRAATTMALLRHATLAYAAQDSGPASVLGRLSDFVNRTPHDYFATVLCTLVDLDARRLTVASAGHMAPLLLSGRTAAYVAIQAGVPIGVPAPSGYLEETVPIPPDATLVAFTDGLVERRGEVIDVGLERLRGLAIRRRLDLDELLSELAGELVSRDHHDDTAIVGIEWQS